MNKKIREKCGVKLIECVHVTFLGKLAPTGRIREDDGIVTDFLDFCVREKIVSLRFGGTVGGGVYTCCHRNVDKKKIAKFFNRQGIKVEEFET